MKSSLRDRRDSGREAEATLAPSPLECLNCHSEAVAEESLWSIQLKGLDSLFFTEFTPSQEPRSFVSLRMTREGLRMTSNVNSPIATHSPLGEEEL